MAGEEPTWQDEPVRRRPDPRPMRLTLGMGAVAAVSVMAAGMIRFPPAKPTSTDVVTEPAAPQAQTVEVHHIVQYLHLKPGQQAPLGATVIDANAPAPRVVVSHVAAPPGPAPTPRVIVKTHQSGHP